MPKGNGKVIPRVVITKSFTEEDQSDLLQILEDRFRKNIQRHPEVQWNGIQQKLLEDATKLKTLFQMEQTGGEPDVVSFPNDRGTTFFVDCAPETPLRRSICYDQKGEQERVKKGLIPGGNAMEIAEKMGIGLLDEQQYRHLQTLGAFDTKTSSWIKTPENIRKLGGALFMERRYDTVFLFHNSAKSFYSDRGFRGMVRILSFF